MQRVRWLLETDEGTVGKWFVDPEHLAQLHTETAQNQRLWPRQGTEEFLARGCIDLTRRAARLPAHHLVGGIAPQGAHRPSARLTI